MNGAIRTLVLTLRVAVGALLTGCSGTVGSTASAPGAAPCGTSNAAGPVVLATGEQGAQALAVDAKNVYWIKTADISAEPPGPPPDGQVLQCGKCGCQHPIVLASAEPIGTGQAGIAVDATSVYWTNGDVMKVPIGGGPATTLAVAKTQGPLSVDATSVYWADSRGLMKVTIAGGPATTLVQRSGDVGALALGAANVYYVAGNGIFKVPLEGGAPTLLAMADSPNTLAVDATNVYWTNFGDSGSNGTVMKIAMAGGPPTTLASGIRSPFGLAVDAIRVYWTGDNAVMAVPIAGGAAATLVPQDAAQGPFGIAVDTTSVYWTNGLQGPVVMKLTK